MPRDSVIAFARATRGCGRLGTPARRHAARHAGTSTLRSIMDQSKQTKLVSFLMINLKAIRIAFGVLLLRKHSKLKETALAISYRNMGSACVW